MGFNSITYRYDVDRHHRVFFFCFPFFSRTNNRDIQQSKRKLPIGDTMSEEAKWKASIAGDFLN